MARLRSTARGPRRQRGQQARGILSVRQLGSGSPQPSQSGGVSGAMELQQPVQIGPRVGCSSGAPQAPQAGANTTANSASRRVARSVGGELDPLGVAPQAFQSVEQAGFGCK